MIHATRSKVGNLVIALDWPHWANCWIRRLRKCVRRMGPCYGRPFRTGRSTKSRSRSARLVRSRRKFPRNGWPAHKEYKATLQR